MVLKLKYSDIMKRLNLFGLLVIGACAFQACKSPEGRAGNSDSTQTDSSATASSTTDTSAANVNKRGTAGTGEGEMGTGNTGSTTAESDMGTDNSSSPDKKDSSKKGMSSNITNESKVSSDEANFMKKAALGGMMEVDLGQIALKSTNPKVKAFAQQMVTDHTKANNELKALAAKSGILLPTAYPEEDKAHMDMMKKMTGAEFDKHYIGMMVTGHEKTVALFKTASSSRSKPVSDFAKKTLPVITGHYEKAKAIQAELK